MKTRNVAWLFTTFLAIVAAVGIVWGATGTFDKTLTLSQLQQKIDEKMPFTAKTITLQNVHLNLDDNKINLNFDASTVKFRSQYAVSAATTGDLRYDSEHGAFFFSPQKVSLSNFTVNDRVVGARVNGFVDRLLGDSRLAEHKSDLKASADAIVQKAVEEGAQHVLKRIPVYKFKDDIKGTIIKLTLTGVEVRDNTVIAHISFWRLTITVLFSLVALVFALVVAVALTMSPGWGALPLLLL